MRRADGTEREIRQPYMRGGAKEPLDPEELRQKFEDNLRFGGFDEARIDALRAALEAIVAGSNANLSAARA